MVDGALGKAAGGCFGLGVDFFVNSGHRDAERGADLEQGLGKILHEGAVGEGDAVVKHG